MERGTDITDMKRKYRDRNEGDFPKRLKVILRKEWDLKYGENPNQHAAIYYIDSINRKNASTMAKLTDLVSVRSDGKGKGGLSLTNTMDISRAMSTLKYFDEPTVVFMKHNLVSGFATRTSPDQLLMDLLRLARDCDRRGNFGGTLATNVSLDIATAQAMYELPGFFVDVLAAPGYQKGVLERIEKASKNIRIAEFSNLNRLPKFQGDETYNLLSIKEMPGGRVGVQDIYLTSIRGIEDLVTDPMVIDKKDNKHIIARDPVPSEADDLLRAWYVNIEGSRSNGIVIMRDGVLVCNGSGQQERVGAVEQAIMKGMQKAMDREGIEYDPLMGIQGYEKLKDNPFKGAVCASDGFYPFNDSINLFGRIGITSTVQPCGSIKDSTVIDAANRYKIAMAATRERCFGHF